MRLSVNEVLLNVVKAGRGAGLPEGVCEDLGRAAAWLCRAGLDGLGAALAAVEAPGARAPAAAVTDGARWVFDPASAAVAGPSALDLLVAGPERIALLAHVDSPLLLVGHAGVAAHDFGRAFRLSDGAGCWAIVGDDALAWRDPRDREPPGDCVRIEIATDDAAATPVTPALAGTEVDDRILARVHALAARACVPASAASRARGAGAGLVDAD